MRILILGATSFIGSHLISYASTQNIEVIALSRNGKTLDGVSQSYSWSFGQLVPTEALKNIDCAIHLAYDFDGESGAKRTIESTLEIVSQLKEAGIKRQIFFSSYSAGEHATSLYGQTKFHIEKAITADSGLIILRPGLVLGNGGIYGRIRKWAQRLPFVPLPNGGHDLVPVIELKKLCMHTINLVLSTSPPAEMNIFEPELKSLRGLVLEAAAEVEHQPWIIPVPTAFLISVLSLATKMHLPLPVNADNLTGFLANQSAQHTSTLKQNEHD
jgi:nucleoside-diphosphate-sugar epimerase